ncbi:hypothetical protein AgCh_028823 [Apium graveolens]
MQFEESSENTRIPESEYKVHILVIIKNEDLEEQKELGSGTFGTIYHGNEYTIDGILKDKDMHAPRDLEISVRMGNQE